MARSAASSLVSLASLLALSTLGACGPSAPPARPGPPPVPLHFQSACDLAPAAGLEWVVEAEPRAIAETSDLIPAIATVVPEARFNAFAASHGGIDLRRISDLCVVRYKGALLTIARTPVDASRVAKSFEEISSRTPVRANVVANPVVTRLSGDVNGEPQNLLVIGNEGVVREEGKAGPLRASEAFLLGRLRRSAPALRGAALKPIVAALGDAPIRVLSPGPFEGESGKALGGLLRGATAVGVAVRFDGPIARLRVRVVLAGAWGTDAPAAGERLAAATHVLAESPAGRLFGIDKPLEGPKVEANEDALKLEAVFDGMAFARGLHAALDAEVGEIMGHILPR